MARSAPTAPLLGALRKILGQPLSELKDAIEGRRPLHEATLFLNDHDEQARILRALLDEAERQQLELQIREFDARTAQGSTGLADRISVAVLRNLLETHEQIAQALRSEDDLRNP